MLSVVMLSVVMLSVFVLLVIMLSVVMLSVVAPNIGKKISKFWQYKRIFVNKKPLLKMSLFKMEQQLEKVLRKKFICSRQNL